MTNPEIGRRTFLKGTTAVGAGAAVFLQGSNSYALATGQVDPDPPGTDEQVVFRYTSCQNCHAKCGLRAKIVDGILEKLDGNPYNPHNGDTTTGNHLHYSIPTAIGDITPAPICAKGQAGIQVLYDPFRVKSPMRRVGPRGSGEWETITWAEAIDEIVNGSVALSHDGLAAYRDLTNDIDPQYPELGKKVNQILFAPGRFPHGHKEFGDRIFKSGIGTINYRHDHTSICETSHHVAGDLRTWNRVDDKKGKHHWKPDIPNSEFIIFFGANVLSANFNFVDLAGKLSRFNENGGQWVVVDPRFSSAATKATGVPSKGIPGWLPVMPGADAALALGMARHIVENSLYDETYLRNTSSDAADADGETTWTDATYLVRTDTMEMLRSDDAGLGGTHDEYVVAVVGVPMTNSAAGAETGDLEFTGVVNAIPVKSVFTLLTERLQEKTVAEYAAIADPDGQVITQTVIEELAEEFTSHGKKAVANGYRGPCQHTSGVYTMHAIMILNQLVGNYDWKGGNQVGGGHWDEFELGNKTVPNAVSASGIRITRVGADYETDAPSLFGDEGYPARRPWFPYATNGAYQEVIPSAAEEYPYGLKALITYWNAWPYSTPAHKEIFENYMTGQTQGSVELFVAIDTHIGETSSYADYILPDTTYLEKWAAPHPAPSTLAKSSPLRQPVVGTFDGKAWNAPFDPAATNDHVGVLPNAKNVEDILIALGKAMGIPGVGTNSFTDGSSLDNAWDWAKTMVDSLALDSGASAADVIAKGGVFADPGTEYDGDHVTKKYGKHLWFYLEELAKQKDSYTGVKWDGLPKYEPAQMFDGTLVDDSAEYPYRLITYKSVIHAMGRTACLPWLMTIAPENFVEINTADATSIGVVTGDKVKITSPSNATGITGMAKVTPGVRPGVVAIPHSYGHWQVNAVGHEKDGTPQGYDRSRGRGLQPNLVMRLDTAAGNVGLQDSVGGSASFYDSSVQIIKVG